MPRTAKDRPTTPWVPSTVSVAPVARLTTVTRATKAGPGKDRTCWEVRWVIDGMRYKKRFYKAGDAERCAEDLRSGRALQQPFDPVAARFVTAAATVPPPEPAAGEVETVVSWTDRYWSWKWAALEPKPRSELARYLNRARSFFVDTEPAGDLLTAVGEYLAKASLTVQTPAWTDGQRIGRDWLAQHSVPLASVGRADLERFLEHYRRNSRYPDREVSPTSLRRMAADLKQCWTRAVTEDVLAANPWDRIELRTRSTRGTRTATGRGALTADADLVLAPDQIWQLADACVERGTWDRSVLAFVVLMGFCGLRPNEAVGLVTGDLELPPAGTGWLTVRRTRRRVPDRYLDTEEDPDWGPLKGRDLADSRRVPIPAQVVAAVRQHLDDHRPGAGPEDLVFVRYDKPFDLSVFSDDVWIPARAHLFPPRPGLPVDSPLQPKLSRLRRHDLRHSACSLWLRARVDVTICQRWSGHRQLSVFLDIYQGVIPGREQEGVNLLEAALNTD